MTATFEKTSIVAAEQAEIWPWVTSPEGINDELMPVMRMTVPAQLRGKSIQEMPLRERIGRSWFLLFGFVPIDYDDITLAERDSGRRFLERSTMMSMASWEHERTLTPCEGGTEVKDRVAFQMRPPLGWIPGAHAFMRWALGSLFAHRHRRLGRWARSRGEKALQAVSSGATSEDP